MPFKSYCFSKLARYFEVITDCRLTLEKIASYYAGDPFPDGSVGEYLRELEERCFRFESDESQAGGDSC